MSLRIPIAVVLIGFPLVISAQTYKCIDANGKTYYQDSACPSGTTAKQQKTGTQKPRPALDTSCSHEFEQESRYCDSNEIGKRCFRERVSPNCMKQVEAAVSGGNPSLVDVACKQEVERANGSCSSIPMSAAQRCLQERLSTNCKEKEKQAEMAKQKLEAERRSSAILKNNLSPHAQQYVRMDQACKSGDAKACAEFKQIIARCYDDPKYQGRLPPTQECAAFAKAAMEAYWYELVTKRCQQGDQSACKQEPCKAILGPDETPNDFVQCARTNNLEYGTSWARLWEWESSSYASSPGTYNGKQVQVACFLSKKVEKGSTIPYATIYRRTIGKDERQGFTYLVAIPDLITGGRTFDTLDKAATTACEAI